MTDDQPTREVSRAFGQVAEAYDRGRPGYPAEAVTWLLGSEPQIVLELGAGTGKLTAELVRQGHAVHATEPDREMLDVLEKQVPGASVKQSSAEDIPANDRSVDVVVVGQAFHWFDHARALPEIARVLRPGGRLALLHNAADLRIPWVRRLGDIIGTQDHDWSPDVLVESDLFGFVEDASFKHRQDVNRESILDLARSRSNVASLQDGPREAKLAEVLAFYDDYGRGMDGMQLPYLTRCYRATVVRGEETGTDEDGDAPQGDERPVAEPPADPAAPGDQGDRPIISDGTDTDMLLIDFR